MRWVRRVFVPENSDDDTRVDYEALHVTHGKKPTQRARRIAADLGGRSASNHTTERVQDGSLAHLLLHDLSVLLDVASPAEGQLGAARGTSRALLSFLVPVYAKHASQT